MFNLFPRLTKQDNHDQQYYSGETITFNQLIEKVRSKNPLVELARDYGKGSDQYDQIKKTALPVIFANGYTARNTRSTKSYFKSTGYMYLDFDFDSIEEANQYKAKILTTQHQFIAACWLSLSGKGLSVLVKVNPEKCNKYQFLKYWDKLNELFQNDLDPRTRDFYRLVCLSSDENIFVNTNAIPFDTIYTIDYDDGLNYSTPIPLDKFESINKPVVYPDGLDVLKLDFFKYRMNKVKVGKRTSTIGAISMQLIALNPDASKKQLLNALLSFNRNYCQAPLPEKEVSNIVTANLKKPVLDIMNNCFKYSKKQFVFFHPDCRIPKHLRDKIRGEEMSKLTAALVNDAVDNIIDQVRPKKITVEMISEYIGKSVSTVYKHLSQESKSKIIEYNKNVPFSISHIYSPMGYNMQQKEKGTFTKCQLRIYEALESLQDNTNRITQQRIADHLGINVKTVKRNWMPCFKSLVMTYNNSITSAIKKDAMQVNILDTEMTNVIL